MVQHLLVYFGKKNLPIEISFQKKFFLEIRVPGKLTAIKELRDMYDRGLTIELNNIYSPATISSLLKNYLQSLPEPIIPIKNFDRERERLLSKIVDKRQTVDVQQYIKYINKHIREYEEELTKTYKSTITTPTITIEKSPFDEENLRWTFSGSLYFIGTTLTTIGKTYIYKKLKYIFVKFLRLK